MTWFGTWGRAAGRPCRVRFEPPSSHPNPEPNPSPNPHQANKDKIKPRKTIKIGRPGYRITKQMDPESEHYAPDDLDKNNENMEKVPCMYLCMCMSLRISLCVSFSSCVFLCVHRQRAHPHPGEGCAPGPVSMGTWM